MIGILLKTPSIRLVLNINFYLIRHGVTDWNITRRFQGHQDVPLNTHGKNQAILTAKELRSINLDRIYTSDLSRAAETARIIWKEQVNSSLHITKDLREGYGGELEGRVFGSKLGNSEISSLNSLRSMIKNHGESLDDVFERTMRTFNRIVQSAENGSNIAVVSHGGPIRLFIGFVKGVRHSDVIGMKLGNCSITRIRYDDGKWTIADLNSISHLGEYYSKKIKIVNP